MTQPTTPLPNAKLTAQVSAHLTAAPTASLWVTILLNIFESTILPLLATFILAAAPKIKTSPALQKALKDADVVIQGLITQ